MAQGPTTTNASTNNGNTNTNGNGAGTTKREAKAPTAVDALGKITKILDQLKPMDRKRTLAFVTASYDAETGESTT